ncbi:MAG: dihydrokaempferol 4-reductase [Pseudomonadota bacterium]|jgi:dihydroflavonol-4-reductase
MTTEQQAIEVAHVPRRRFWVGGATGFLGEALVTELLNAGHDVVPTSKRGGTAAGLVCQAVDACDAEAVRRSAEGCDGAFFCVGKVSRSAADAELLHELNVKATEVALPALAQAGVPRVVYASTSGTIAVGTDPTRVYNESSETPHSIISRWPYYRSKLFGERSALGQCREGFEVVVVNPSLLLGPGDKRGSSNRDVMRLLNGTLPALSGGGIAIVDVRDAAQGMRLAFERGRSGERYLLSAANLSCVELFGRLARIANVKAPEIVLPRHREAALLGHWLYKTSLGLVGGIPAVDAETVDMGSHFWYCDCSRALRELGFAPRDTQETLRDTVNDLLGSDPVS